MRVTNDTSAAGSDVRRAVQLILPSRRGRSNMHLQPSPGAAVLPSYPNSNVSVYPFTNRKASSIQTEVYCNAAQSSRVTKMHTHNTVYDTHAVLLRSVIFLLPM
jgi:hypothetical protein